MNMERELKRMLDADGHNGSIEKTKGNHIRIVLSAGDQSRAVIAPSTPSDHRSIANTRAQLRRVARELSGGPPPPPPQDAPPARKKKPRPATRSRPDVSFADPLDLKRERDRGTFIEPPLEDRTRLYGRPTRADGPRFLPIIEEESMPLVERKQRLMVEAEALDRAIRRKEQPAPDAPAAKQARTPLERLAAIEAKVDLLAEHFMALLERLGVDARRATETAAGGAVPQPATTTAPEAEAAPAAPRAARGQAKKPGPHPSKIRRLLTGDPRWHDWRMKNGVSSATITFTQIRALGREWGYTDEAGHWTEHGRALAEEEGIVVDEPEPQPAVGAVRGHRRNGEPYRVSEKQRIALAANAAKARAAKAAKRTTH